MKKDPDPELDPDPYLWLMDLDTRGPKPFRSALPSQPLGGPEQDPQHRGLPQHCQERGQQSPGDTRGALVWEPEQEAQGPEDSSWSELFCTGEWGGG